MADSDPSLHFDDNPDQTFFLWCGSGYDFSLRCGSGSRSCSSSSDENLRPHSTRLHFEPLRLYCERSSPFMAPFEPPQLLYYDFADPDFTLMRIQISLSCGSGLPKWCGSGSAVTDWSLLIKTFKKHKYSCAKKYKTKALSEKIQVTTLVFTTGIEVINETKIEYNQWYGSGFRRAKITHKSRKNLEISCFEVLDGLF